MPIFDYICPNCRSVKRDVLTRIRSKEVKCSRCRDAMKRLVPTGVQADVFPADGVYLEHVSANGETFHSKGEMKRYAKENKLELGYL